MDDLTALARAAGEGDPVALAKFIRATQADVWRFCAHLASPGEADDLTQETYLRALPALPRFAARSTARTWLLAIARRTVADHHRRLRRRRTAETGGAPAGPEHGGGLDLHGELSAALRTLDIGRQQAFVLTQVLGLSYAEAAAVCGCPVGTIRSRVARARADLVSFLEGGGRARHHG